jgi:hypothetical protein
MQAMNDKDRKVVNTEEQNRAVNPGNQDFEEESSPKESPVITKSAGNSTPESEKPERAADVEAPHRTEGDDADSIERKSPKL